MPAGLVRSTLACSTVDVVALAFAPIHRALCDLRATSALVAGPRMASTLCPFVAESAAEAVPGRRPDVRGSETLTTASARGIMQTL
jgi:hypothetical protein